MKSVYVLGIVSLSAALF